MLAWVILLVTAAEAGRAVQASRFNADTMLPLPDGGSVRFDEAHLQPIALALFAATDAGSKVEIAGRLVDFRYTPEAVDQEPPAVVLVPGGIFAPAEPRGALAFGDRRVPAQILAEGRRGDSLAIFWSARGDPNVTGNDLIQAVTAATALDAGTVTVESTFRPPTPLSPEVVRGVEAALEAIETRLFECSDHLAARPTIRLQIVYDSRRVRSVTVKEPRNLQPAIADCVSAVIRSAKFPPPSGHVVVINHLINGTPARRQHPQPPAP